MDPMNWNRLCLLLPPLLLASLSASAQHLWWNLEGQTDGLVAMYHDQGLIPVKLIDFDDAVNVTLGLSIIRTSPDHGTAYDVAGRGIARATSFAAALRLAGELVARRASVAK